VVLMARCRTGTTIRLSCSTAEALVIATPGIERFDYFRHVVRRREGSEPAGVLFGLQDRFDTHFLESPAWQRSRSGKSSKHPGVCAVPAAGRQDRGTVVTADDLRLLDQLR
jgi:hypothetical protein